VWVAVDVAEATSDSDHYTAVDYIDTVTRSVRSTHELLRLVCDNQSKLAKHATTVWSM